MKTLLVFLLAAGLSACSAQEAEHPDTMDPDGMSGEGTMEMDHDGMSADMEASAIAAAEAFRQAIVSGDSTAAGEIILEDAIIVEGGRTESREHYLSGHFKGDGAFLSAMTREPLDRKVSVSGHVAWITSVSRLHGTYRNNDTDMTSAELMVLKQDNEGWKVAAVHWSSRSN
jgi:ketosteroid isomerase-like protein